MMARPLVSIVCPAHREEEVLPLFHAAVLEVLAPLSFEYEFEIVYVDDGSKDDTLGVMRSFAVDPRVRYLALSRNFGKEAALTCGVEHARGAAVITMDCDLEHPPRHIPDLLSRWKDGADLVLTTRKQDRRLSWFKRNSSMLFYKVLGKCSTVDVRESITDFRLMSRPVVDALVRMKESHRYTPGIVQWLGFNTVEFCFVPDARAAGVTKYHMWNLMKLALDALFSFSPAPARMAMVGGLAATGLSWFVSMTAVVLWIGLGEPAGRLGAIALTALHVLAASGMVVGGTLGEYAFRIYEQSKARPVFLVKESNVGAAAAMKTPRPVRHRKDRAIEQWS
jgi:glycosyltransferase involved in cell wall biosynthesis